MFRESSLFRFFWDCAVVVAVVVSLFLIPLRVVFGIFVLDTDGMILTLIDMLLIADILLNAVTSHRRNGIEVTAPKETIWLYFSTTGIVDVLANIPLPYPLLSKQSVVAHALLLLRLLRVNRFLSIFRRWERLNSSHAGYLRLFKLMVILLVAMHLIACVWYLSAMLAGFPPDSWIVRRGLQEASPLLRYVQSIYWTVITMTTVGYGDITPARNIEYLLAAMVALLGASTYAFMIGNVASVVGNLNAAKTTFWNRAESVNRYLHERKLPHEINRNVREYYEYIWARYRGEREHSFLDELPAQLREGIMEHLMKDVVEGSPIFTHCTPSLRRVLLLSLTSHTYPPGAIVLREDELGKEICFLIEGHVRIVSMRDGVEHGSFKAGEHFGDFSMILRERRTASVIAEDYCEIFLLERKTFDRIKEEYPEFADVLSQTASTRSERIAKMLLDGIIV